MRLPTQLRLLRRPWRQFMRTATDLLLPDVCPACGGAGSGLCRPCDQNLVRRPRSGCVRCGEVVVAAGQACGREHAELRGLAHLVAPWRYAGTGGALVRRFKLDGDAGAGQWLARAMAEAFRAQVGRSIRRGAVVVPVPLHAARRAARGFDQAGWLARILAARLDFAAAVGALRRVRATRPQGDPQVTSRDGNVAGAFALAPAARSAIHGRHVLLVDDVFTSGATARACAAVLREAGAVAVTALCACRS